MVKEDVLDLCARHDIFLSTDQVQALYRREHSTAVLARIGWRVMLPTEDLRDRAFTMRIKECKVVCCYSHADAKLSYSCSMTGCMLCKLATPLVVQSRVLVPRPSLQNL